MTEKKLKKLTAKAVAMIAEQCARLQKDLLFSDDITPELDIYYNTRTHTISDHITPDYRHQHLIAVCGYDWYWRYQESVEDHIAHDIMSTYPDARWYDDDWWMVEGGRAVITRVYQQRGVTKRDIARLTREAILPEIQAEWEEPLRDIILQAEEAGTDETVEPVDLGAR